MREIFVSIFCVASLGLACSDDDGPATTTSSSSNGAGLWLHASTARHRAEARARWGSGSGTALLGNLTPARPAAADERYPGDPKSRNFGMSPAPSTRHVLLHNDSALARFFSTKSRRDLGTYNVTTASAVAGRPGARRLRRQEESARFCDPVTTTKRVTLRLTRREPTTLATGTSRRYGRAFVCTHAPQNARQGWSPLTARVHRDQGMRSRTYGCPTLDVLQGYGHLRGNSCAGRMALVAGADFTSAARICQYTNVFYYPRGEQRAQTLADARRHPRAERYQG